MQETQIRFLGREDPLEEGMETHSRILAWEIPWAGESGGLRSVWSQRVRHDWAHTLRGVERRKHRLLGLTLGNWVEEPS